MNNIVEFLNTQKQNSLYRTLKPITGRFGAFIEYNSKKFLDFSSNDYLGLRAHPAMIKVATQSLQEHGVGAGASRLLSGDHELYHLLEDKVAKLKGKDAALVFNSGYQANLGIIQALTGEDSCIFSDKLNHASIIDGMRLSGAKFYRFKHNDVDHLESLIKKYRADFKNALIITETVFSMDGDISPLKELVSLKKKYDLRILVDEAHATGVFGKSGAGVVEQEDLVEEVDYVMGTFSKALGSFGAYVATTKEVKEYLINICRSFIYSTALPLPLIAANIKSIELLQEEPCRRIELLKNAKYFRVALKDMGFEVKGDSQIIPLITKDNQKAVNFSEKLLELGFNVLPIRPPTVPKDKARLRFSLTYNHKQEMLEELLDVIKQIK